MSPDVVVVVVVVVAAAVSAGGGEFKLALPPHWRPYGPHQLEARRLAGPLGASDGIGLGWVWLVNGGTDEAGGAQRMGQLDAWASRGKVSREQTYKHPLAYKQTRCGPKDG